jgi:hypothetical protein
MTDQWTGGGVAAFTITLTFAVAAFVSFGYILIVWVKECCCPPDDVTRSPIVVDIDDRLDT